MIWLVFGFIFSLYVHEKIKHYAVMQKPFVKFLVIGIMGVSLIVFWYLLFKGNGISVWGMMT